MLSFIIKSKSIILWGMFLPIFLLITAVNVANASDSYTVDCYVGESKIGELPATKIDETLWVPVINVAEILNMKISSAGDEVVVSNNNLTVRVVKNASVARIGNMLVSLVEIPREINGALYLGEKSLNFLFPRALGRESKEFVSFRTKYNSTDSAASTSGRSNEPLIYSGSVVRQEKPAGRSTPVSTSSTVSNNRTNDALAEVSEIRWNVTQQKIRVVLECVGYKDPTLKRETDRIIISSAIFPADIESQAEDRIQVKKERDSLIFAGKWLRADTMLLANPKRILIEFIFDDRTPQTPPQSQPQPINMANDAPAKSNLVVLDPGHGGKDPGAVANGIREKDVNLAIAIRIESALKSKGIQAVLTRRTDVYLGLAERTEIANKHNAAAFVSIHANALPPGRSARGFEIYIMALPTDKDALELAKIENRELVDGKIDTAVSDRRTQLLLSILGDMQQNNKIIESTDFAEVLYKAGNQSGLPMRRVAQAPFYVLRGAAMPAVLLETGFLTDRDEARLLSNSGYQQKIADSMALGIINYMRGR